MENDTGNTRVTLVGIIVEDKEAAGRINGLLHEYGEYIIGRMGIPYHEKQMNIISVVMDAPQEKVSALSGKLGMGGFFLPIRQMSLFVPFSRFMAAAIPADTAETSRPIIADLSLALLPVRLMYTAFTVMYASAD